MSAADITGAMLADFNSMKGGSVFDATQLDSLDNETSYRNPLKGHNLRSVRDPIGYTRATPDPTMETSIFHLHRVTKRIPDTFIPFSGHLMVCHQPPVRGIRR